MLMKLGIDKDWASRIAFSRKKYWRLAATQQIHKTLGNSYWKRMGLVDIVAHYQEARITL